MSAPKLSRLDAFRVERAKQLLAEIKALDSSRVWDAYALLGRTEVVLAGLIEVIEEGDAL